MTLMCRPAIALPDHRVELDELIDHVSAAHADHPRLADVLRGMRATTVRTRHYSRPLAEVTAPAGIEHHRADALALAARAAREALEHAGLDPFDVDGLVVSCTTGYGVPGLDVDLVTELGLPATVRRIPVTQLGCAGGVFGLVRAAERDGVTLVVAVDLLSTLYRPDQTDLPGMILKGLLGDAAGAAVVRSDLRGSGLILERTREYLIPGSTTNARAWLTPTGPAFVTERDLLDAPAKILPELSGWLTGRPEFVIAHPGGPRIVTGLADGLGIPPELLGNCVRSLEELGNVGGASALDVAARLFAEPPAPGARGLLFALGPGLTVMAAEAIWRP